MKVKQSEKVTNQEVLENITQKRTLLNNILRKSIGFVILYEKLPFL